MRERQRNSEKDLDIHTHTHTVTHPHAGTHNQWHLNIYFHVIYHNNNHAGTPGQSTHKMDGSVYGWKQDAQGMNTPTGSEEKKVAKVGMVEVTTASVDPGTVVIHLHHTSAQ